MPRNRWKNALFRLLALLIVLSKQSPRPGNLMKPRHNDTTHLYHHKSKGNKATMAERRSILLVAASCLLSTASSMYITVDQEKFKCESRSVKAKFSYLCNPDAICSVSEEKTQYVEGTCTSRPVVRRKNWSNALLQEVDSHVFCIFPTILFPIIIIICP